jgi:hypothetical protein
MAFAIFLIPVALVLIFALSRAPDHDEERVRLAGEDDQDIDFDAALRSLDRDRPHSDWEPAR